MELNLRNTCYHKGGMGRPCLTNYPKGARAVGELACREVLELIFIAMAVRRGIPALRSLETVAGFLKLVVLCKGLVLDP
jgi:hypothetical protein